MQTSPVRNRNSSTWYEKEARQSREDEKYFYDKIGEAYATMMLVTADMRKLRMSVIKQMANIEACRPLKPIVINV